jgi:hypothetical protein
MGKTRKSHRKSTRKTRKTHSQKMYRKRMIFNKSNVAPKRVDIMRGGNGTAFPASMNNNVVSPSPQSFLPFNNFLKDPGYSSIAARNTGPLLTGVSSGGGRRKRRQKGGNSSLQSAINNYPPVHDITGASSIMSVFSGSPSPFSSSPLRISPLA